MLQANFPVGVGVVVHQMVVMTALLLAKLGGGDDGHAIHSIHTRLIECHRIEGGKETYIRDYGQVVFTVAVAVGGDLNDQIDVEVRPSLADGQSILAYLAVEFVVGTAVIIADGIGWADFDAAPASHALVVVNPGESIGDMRCIVGTDVHTVAAADAHALIYLGLPVTVHLHLSSS